jgi:hypothetical protein
MTSVTWYGVQPLDGAHGQRLDVDAICGEAVKWYDVLDCIMDSVRVPNESSGPVGRGYNPGEP